MSRYLMRHAEPGDKPAITHFMNTHWGSLHPLINNPVFFEYYFRPDGGPLQFCLAEDESGIAALAGYIKASAGEHPDIWVSIWCAKKGANGAGLELMGAMAQLTGCGNISCNNIRKNTTAFYTFLGYTAQRLPHYYRLAERTAYTVAKIAKKQILPATGNAKLIPVESFAALQAKFTTPKGCAPHKDLWYINRRYFNYPFPQQEYLVYGMQDENGNFNALLVVRKITVERTNILRIVDYIGPAATFAGLGSAINLLMQHFAAEYIDCYCYGISSEFFAKAGFNVRLEKDENIIPNYLTPPLYENTEYYFFTADTANFTMFKADGDQDRPNLI